MNYSCGPNNPIFTGTDEQWNELKQTIVWYNEDISSYPFVTVTCPHCGAKNTHTDNGKGGHKQCDLIRDKKGKTIYYDCPGYCITKISSHLNSKTYSTLFTNKNFKNKTLIDYK